MCWDKGGGCLSLSSDSGRVLCSVPAWSPPPYESASVMTPVWGIKKMKPTQTPQPHGPILRSGLPGRQPGLGSKAPQHPSRHASAWSSLLGASLRVTTGMVRDRSRTQKPQAGVPTAISPSAPHTGLSAHPTVVCSPTAGGDPSQGPPRTDVRGLRSRPGRQTPSALTYAVLRSLLFFTIWPNLTQNLLAPRSDPDPPRG